MPSTQDIRRRIRSIKNTRQLTRAMELVASAKMRRAQEQALRTRAYARLAWEMVHNLSGKADIKSHKLLRPPEAGINRPEAGTTAILLLTSNRGLIGAFNSNILRAALDYAAGRQVVFVTMGKKGRDGVRKRGFEVVADFEKPDTAESIAAVHPVVRLLTDDFLSGKYAEVVMIYMDFISTLKQRPHIRQILPLTEIRDEFFGKVGLEIAEELEPEAKTGFEYLFEPTPDQVLAVLLPRLLEMQVYQALLETNAAEHSARMVAMKNASDAASDLTDELTLEFNKLRQANITKEISEIVAGQLAVNR